MNTKPTTSSQNGENSSGNLPCKNSLNFLADVGVMQQPTAKVIYGNGQSAFRSNSGVDASQTKFLSRTLPCTRSSMGGLLRVGAPPLRSGAAISSSDRNTIMKIINNVKKPALAPEGVHVALVKSVKAKGDAKCVVEFEITVEQREYTATKVYPAKLQCGAPLVDDAEVILGKSIACDQEGAEFDMDELVGKACQVVVEHKKTSGGRIIAAVGTVFEPVNAEAVAK